MISVVLPVPIVGVKSRDPISRKWKLWLLGLFSQDGTFVRLQDPFDLQPSLDHLAIGRLIQPDAASFTPSFRVWLLRADDRPHPLDCR